ncbi:hypothetical protein Mgra_00003469 [Meloidogyne graminicola]|uniref:Uncharacterized protein n=1 Tax=Meloidogyne graminicola TaxID=189291 RepID=A0A8S9ZV40_9BILA|nr:hypothetical protein Mgra_00003469 [Meloidogyne graminicola]
MASQKIFFIFIIALFIFTTALFIIEGNAEKCYECIHRVCGPPCKNPNSDACDKCMDIDRRKQCPDCFT